MATNTTIQNTVNWALAFVVQRLLTGVAAIPGEPTITTVNIIMGTILGAPFKWEWNRTNLIAAFPTVAGTSDYKVSLPTFGYLEKAVIFDPAAPAQTSASHELEVYKVLGKESKRNRPDSIATLLDDNNGNITFRLFPVPDKVYKVDLVFQNAPIFVPQGANLSTTTWAPIPDKMAYIYQRGYLAQVQGIYNSQLFLAGMEMFFRQLVAAAEGLTEAEKAIYLDDQLRILRTKAADMLTTQQGSQARG